jgi:predicted DNA-binding transcriptional regulator AlpA
VSTTIDPEMDEVDVSRTPINVKNRNLIRLRGLKQIVPFGTTKVYALIKDRKLPPPIKIGRASFWDADEIHAAVDQLIKER